jgi:hypothetical protein
MWKQFFGRKRRAILLENLALQFGGGTDKFDVSVLQSSK